MVNLATGAVSNDGSGNVETVNSIEAVAGTTGNDSLTAGLNTTLAGGAGDDLFTVQDGVGNAGVISDFTAGAGSPTGLMFPLSGSPAWRNCRCIQRRWHEYDHPA